ncbi:CUL4 [Symbiodinium sp. CCMP2592]|nr:CUL4 [Symbiodinium sp. CCMP2592]
MDMMEQMVAFAVGKAGSLDDEASDPARRRHHEEGSVPSKKARLLCRPRFLVKPVFAQHPNTDEYVAAASRTLEQAVSALCQRRPLPGGSKQALCRHVEALCSLGLAETLLQELLREVAVQLRQQLSECSLDQDGLPNLVAVALAMCAVLTDISRIYSVLDSAVSRNKADASLYEVLRGHLRQVLLETHQPLNSILRGALRLIREHRRGKVADKQTLKSAIQLFKILDLYTIQLEPQLLEETATFFCEECSIWLEQHGLAKLPEFLAFVERCLAAENSLGEECRMPPSTMMQIRATAQKEMIQKRSEKLLSVGFEGLVLDVQVEALAILYQHFRDIDALPILRRAYGDAVRKAGLNALETSDDFKVVIPSIERLLSAAQEVLTAAFLDDCNFGITLKEALEGSLNSRSANKVAKLLARHMDSVLRGGRGSVRAGVADPKCSQSFSQNFSPPERADSEVGEDAQAGVERAIQIFRYIAAKDTFEAFYKKDLARRLLLQRSASREAELSAASLLREECGNAYTAGIEGMFQDLEISRVLSQNFEATAQAKQLFDETRIEFVASVLTAGRWPGQPSADISIPSIPLRLMTCFANFYQQQHTGRSLSWCPAWGQCVLRATYGTAGGQTRKEFVVSHFQALVLLCFNSANSLSFGEIAEATQIPQADLQLTLQSLTVHKAVRILLRDRAERDAQSTDRFSYNGGFTHKLHRITIATILPKEQLQEEDVAEQRVIGSRQHELDAVIIRIMKAKKKLSHSELLADILASVRFPAEVADIKRRIESLIDREYLEKHILNDQGIACYTYLA